jgi:hypothetical protein
VSPSIESLDEELLHVHRDRALGQLLREHREVAEVPADAESSRDHDAAQDHEERLIIALWLLVRKLVVFYWVVEQTLRHDRGPLLCESPSIVA